MIDHDWSEGVSLEEFLLQRRARWRADTIASIEAALVNVNPLTRAVAIVEALSLAEPAIFDPWADTMRAKFGAVH